MTGAHYWFCNLNVNNAFPTRKYLIQVREPTKRENILANMSKQVYPQRKPP